MKIYNPVASGKASGRALGGVFSFNRGLGTFKKYVKSFNPNTASMQEVKSRFSYLTKYWSKSLTYEQITLWNNWSLPWTDIYGATVLLTGINKFVICNDTLMRAGKPITNIPPIATPSEITSVDGSDYALMYIEIDGISDAEITAQSSFLRIEIIGELESITYQTGILVIKASGIPISRKPLEKNYKTVFFYDCRTGLEGVKELEIQLNKTGTPKALQSLRIQRYNKYGFWSGRIVYTKAIEKSEIITNGRFNTDTAWLKSGGWTIHDGKAYNTGDGQLRQLNLPIEYNTTYKVDFDVIWTSGVNECRIYFLSSWIFTVDSSGHKSFTYSKASGDKELQFLCQSDIVFNVDNVVIEEI